MGPCKFLYGQNISWLWETDMMGEGSGRHQNEKGLGSSSGFETEGATAEEYEGMASRRWGRQRHGQSCRAFGEEQIF